MRTRELRFGLYADEQGLVWVRGLVGEAVARRGARITGETLSTDARSDGGPAAAELYDFLAEQWAVEHPGESSGARRPVELRVRLACSLRTWRAVRKAVIGAMCPAGAAPHVCRVPWMVG
ncbi:hypothetical protein EF912_07795 [Streptomyces sp. WAC07061]|uniref:hypothetical protein n=1 Tax=Streptomyces sp. WAC07061 TaxID=2487410 RepID=UPI000F76E9E3|nr:hypothetical protein [Streptomyces sp. WAC07061]RSS61049.1 hypothetical protein EF912_07795 [Streptomyces sp. WAC07061]